MTTSRTPTPFISVVVLVVVVVLLLVIDIVLVFVLHIVLDVVLDVVLVWFWVCLLWLLYFGLFSAVLKPGAGRRMICLDNHIVLCTARPGATEHVLLNVGAIERGAPFVSCRKEPGRLEVSSLSP